VGRRPIGNAITEASHSSLDPLLASVYPTVRAPFAALRQEPHGQRDPGHRITGRPLVSCDGTPCKCTLPAASPQFTSGDHNTVPAITGPSLISHHSRRHDLPPPSYFCHRGAQGAADESQRVAPLLVSHSAPNSNATAAAPRSCLLHLALTAPRVRPVYNTILPFE
jgi:hypothetical protein